MKLPRHKFWGAGERDCPSELKGANGELHTMRCKVCGDGWRQSSDVCLEAVAELSLQELHALGQGYFSGPLNPNEEMFARAVERAVRRRFLGNNDGALAPDANDEDPHVMSALNAGVPRGVALPPGGQRDA
jgi:hypothetical protein